MKLQTDTADQSFGNPLTSTRDCSKISDPCWLSSSLDLISTMTCKLYRAVTQPANRTNDLLRLGHTTSYNLHQLVPVCMRLRGLNVQINKQNKTNISDCFCTMNWSHIASGTHRVPNSCWGTLFENTKAPSFQIGSRWNLARLFFEYILIDWLIDPFYLLAYLLNL